MKKPFVLFVAALLILAFCAGCGIAGAEGTPITEEAGFVFVEPHDYTDLMETAGSASFDQTGYPWAAEMSAPIITRSLVGKDGYVTYKVSYKLSFGVKIGGVPNGEEPAFYLSPHDYHIYDSYTGKIIEISYGSNKSGNKETEIQIDGQSVLVSRKSEYEYFTGTASWNETINLYSRPESMNDSETLRVPADYDGLVLGIKTSPLKFSYYYRSTYEEFFGEDSGYWADFDNIDSWEFIRISDYAVYETLEKGSRGDSVKELQKILVDLGYLKSGVDGDYGAGTVKAVEAFQSAANLPMTGIADDTTITVLLVAAEKGA